MNDDVAWLAQEVEDLLDAGEVGLYEFVESLRERYPDTDLVQLRPIARAALTELLRDPSIKLGWYQWATGKPPVPAAETDIGPTTFDEIGDDPYLGIERFT